MFKLLRRRTPEGDKLDDLLRVAGSTQGYIKGILVFDQDGVVIFEDFLSKHPLKCITQQVIRKERLTILSTHAPTQEELDLLQDAKMLKIIYLNHDSFIERRNKYTISISAAARHYSLTLRRSNMLNLTNGDKVMDMVDIVLEMAYVNQHTIHVYDRYTGHPIAKITKTADIINDLRKYANAKFSYIRSLNIFDYTEETSSAEFDKVVTRNLLIRKLAANDIRYKLPTKSHRYAILIEATGEVLASVVDTNDDVSNMLLRTLFGEFYYDNRSIDLSGTIMYTNGKLDNELNDYMTYVTPMETLPAKLYNDKNLLKKISYTFNDEIKDKVQKYVREITAKGIRKLEKSTNNRQTPEPPAGINTGGEGKTFVTAKYGYETQVPVETNDEWRKDMSDDKIVEPVNDIYFLVDSSLRVLKVVERENLRKYKMMSTDEHKIISRDDYLHMKFVAIVTNRIDKSTIKDALEDNSISSFALPDDLEFISSIKMKDTFYVSSEVILIVETENYFNDVKNSRLFKTYDGYIYDTKGKLIFKNIPDVF